MSVRRRSVFEVSRSIRDSNAALAAVFAVAAAASTPSARVVESGFRASGAGALSTAAWSVAAALLGGYLAAQFLAAVPAAEEHVASQSDGDYRWSFVYLRAVAVRPFATLLASVWLFALTVVAPYANVPTAPAVLAGVVACSAFVVVVSQPHAGPTLDE